jgi:hypothetical protein
MLDATYSCQRFKPQIMSFYRLDFMTARKPSIAVHHKGNMLWHWALSQGTYEKLP